MFYSNAVTKSVICSKLTMKTPEPRQFTRSGVFIVNFEQILMTLSIILFSGNSTLRKNGLSKIDGCDACDNIR